MKRSLRMMRILTVAFLGYVVGCNSQSTTKPSGESKSALTSPTAQATADEPSDSVVVPRSAPVASVPIVVRPVDWAAVTQGAQIVSVTPEELQGGGLEERYPTPVVEVRGTVLSIDTDLMGPEFSSVRLQGPGGDAIPVRILERQAFARVGPGQVVTLQGKKVDVSAIEHFPFRILDAGVNLCPVITSSQISEDFAKDPQLAHEKYYGQWFYLHGKVADIRKEWDENALVTLEGDSTWPVASWVKKAEAAQIEVGREFSMLAKYEPISELTVEEPKVELKGLPITVEFPAAGMTYGSALLSRTERDAQASERLRAATPEISADAPALIRQFRDSEVQFRSDYGGKVAEVAGTIQEFGVQKDGHPLIHLVGDELLTFDVVLASDAPWDQLQPGQRITTRGQFVRSLFIPQIEHAIIVKSDGPEPPLRQVTAAEVTAGCLNADDKFASDWKDRVVKVTGKIQSINLGGVDPVVVLEGPDDSRVQIELNAKQHARQMRFTEQAVGQTETFLGRINAVDDDAKTVSLKDGWILKSSGGAKQ
ncbi:MAG: hypothetical protein JWP89_55 [Schlesneria sp.]|nr:hypothetical protein [Schlesneria sp.]